MKKTTDFMNETLSPRIENPTRSPAQSVPVIPKFIKIVITEEDRQEAEIYSSATDCLICTALKRANFKVWMVDPNGIHLDPQTYYRFDFNCGSLNNVERDIDQVSKPFYRPSVVGKVISATLVE